MIFYYTATGNSLWTAEKIADFQKERLVNIGEIMKGKVNNKFVYQLGQNEKIGFVYPVHAWYPPKRVLEFINRLEFENYCGQYCFTIAVCAEDAGFTNQKLEHALRKKSIALNARWELQLPNNYIIAIDVDSDELVKKEFEQAEKDIAIWNQKIQKRINAQNHIPCKHSFIKSNIVGNLFNMFGKFSKTTRPFWVKEQCVSCGLCAKICPSQAISLENGKPKWHGSCDGCLACINRCPVHAIEYGKKNRISWAISKF